MYEDSLKYYRDLKNVVDTAFEEGEIGGIEKGIIKRNYEVAKKMKVKGIDIAIIAEITRLSEEEIENL